MRRNTFNNEENSPIEERLKKQVKVSVAKANKMSALEAVDHIVHNSEDSELHPMFFERNGNVLKRLGNLLDISEQQALMLSVATEFARGIDADDVTRYFKCSAARALIYLDVLDEMAKTGMLQRHSGMCTDSFTLTKECLDALRTNKKFVSKLNEKLDALGLIDSLFDILRDVDKENIDLEEGIRQIDIVLSSNSEHTFASELYDMNFSDVNRFIMVYLCVVLVARGRTEVELNAIKDCLNDFVAVRNLTNELKKNKNQLMTDGWMEYTCMDGESTPDMLSLTQKAIDTFLKDYDVDEAVERRNAAGMRSHETLTPKELFYNEVEGEQVKRLTHLLDNAKLKEVQERLKSKGLREGFTCLFYGAPGTGKTETVYQLARLTGRDIVEVNVDAIKDKFVGESEKRIRAVFQSYRQKVRSLKVCPILLFNEADQVLGKRKEGAENAVDKMENAIQNIVLQELEVFEGIMIATTNLTNNLDEAFERRFLYKINFKKPSVEAKRHIWQTMLTDLTDEQATILATKFDFSGGQIENIARKQVVNSILSDNGFDFDSVLADCKQEKIAGKNDDSPRPRVGF